MSSDSDRALPQAAPDAPARPVADDPVAIRLRALRLGLRWSLKKLSAETGGLAPSFLFNIENGRKVPSEDVAARIAHALNDGAHEAVYRAWARVKSRGRSGRVEHEALLEAWDVLRQGFSDDARMPGPDTARSDLGRLRIPVLTSAVDPGDGVRPPAERVVNTLSLDPSLYGHDALLARERLARLRRPFAFPIEPASARAAAIAPGQLAVVTRETPGLEPDPHALFVVRCAGRLELVRGEVLTGAAVPAPLRTEGLADAERVRAALVGAVVMLLPDVRI